MGAHFNYNETVAHALRRAASRLISTPAGAGTAALWGSLGGCGRLAIGHSARRHRTAAITGKYCYRPASVPAISTRPMVSTPSLAR